VTTFANVATTFANGLDCHGGSQVDFDLAKELGEQRRSVPRHHIEKWDLAAIEAEANETPRASWAEDEIVRIERAQRIWNAGNGLAVGAGAVGKNELMLRCAACQTVANETLQEVAQLRIRRDAFQEGSPRRMRRSRRGARARRLLGDIVARTRCVRLAGTSRLWARRRARNRERTTMGRDQDQDHDRGRQDDRPLHAL